MLAPLGLLEAQGEVAVVLGAAEVRELSQTEPEDAIDQRIGELEILAVSHLEQGSKVPPGLAQGRLRRCVSCLLSSSGSSSRRVSDDNRDSSAQHISFTRRLRKHDSFTGPPLDEDAALADASQRAPALDNAQGHALPRPGLRGKQGSSPHVCGRAEEAFHSLDLGRPCTAGAPGGRRWAPAVPTVRSPKDVPLPSHSYVHDLRYGGLGAARRLSVRSCSITTGRPKRSVVVGPRPSPLL